MMKLVSLNTWGGKYHDPLMEFIKKQSETADVFCFQEVYDSARSTTTPSGYQSNLLKELSEVLPDFDYIFSPQFHDRDFHAEVDYPLSQGIATFWRKKLKVEKKGEIFVYGRENEIIPIKDDNIIPPRNFQYVIFENFISGNIHGYWAPSPKFDTPQRLKQSQMILDFLKKYDIPKVIAGDFNLGINTQSVGMFEDAGFRNLVKESKTESTRSSFYDIKWREFDKFADYIFASNDLNVINFKVLADEVSDHLPLLIEFEA